jgi:hypothetical protein
MVRTRQPQGYKGIRRLLERSTSFRQNVGRELHYDKVCDAKIRTTFDHVDLISIHVHFRKSIPGGCPLEIQSSRRKTWRLRAYQNS